MIRVLDDGDVARLARAPRAVSIMRSALIDAHRGRLVSPPRLVVAAGATHLTFGAGGRVGGPVGFRVYGGWGPQSAQLTALWDGDGQLLGAVTGELLGVLRTGALGAAAIDVLSRAESEVLGVIGSGRMAWGQVWAAAAVRRFRRIDVYSPTPERREAFACRVRDELGIECHPVTDARAAVVDHDVVVVSTTSAIPVLEHDWLSPGTHLNSTGPKKAHQSELPVEIVDAAAVLVTDSPGQISAENDWLSARPAAALGGVLAGDVAGRRSAEDTTLYFSVGLTGTEALLAEELFAAELPG